MARPAPRAQGKPATRGDAAPVPARPGGAALPAAPVEKTDPSRTPRRAGRRFFGSETGSRAAAGPAQLARRQHSLP